MAAEQSQAQIWEVSSINAGPGAVLANTAVLRVESKTNETQFHTIHLIQQSPRWKPQTVHLPVSSLSAGPLHLAALPAPPPPPKVSGVPTSMALTSSFILSLAPQHTRGCFQMQSLEERGRVSLLHTFRILLAMSHLSHWPAFCHPTVPGTILLSRKECSWAAESLVSK